MNLRDFVTVAALVAASVAWLRARRAWKRLDRLNEACWELRYECGQLQARLDGLEGRTGMAAAVDPSAGSTSFVPLSSLKR